MGKIKSFLFNSPKKKIEVEKKSGKKTGVEKKTFTE